VERILERERSAVVAGRAASSTSRRRGAAPRAHDGRLAARAPEDHWSRVVGQGDRRPMADHPDAMAELRAMLSPASRATRRRTSWWTRRAVPAAIVEAIARGEGVTALEPAVAGSWYPSRPDELARSWIAFSMKRASARPARPAARVIAPARGVRVLRRGRGVGVRTLPSEALPRRSSGPSHYFGFPVLRSARRGRPAHAAR
jgi:hypothetical protein